MTSIAADNRLDLETLTDRFSMALALDLVVTPAGGVKGWGRSDGPELPHIISTLADFASSRFPHDPAGPLVAAADDRKLDFWRV